MIQRALILAVTLAAPIASNADPYVFTMNGDQFVKMMKAPPSNGPMDPYDYMQREKAYSYLDGTRDGTEGDAWCDLPHQLKTPDLAYELAGEIAKLPAAERKKNASILIRELLSRNFPCNGKKGRS